MGRKPKADKEVNNYGKRGTSQEKKCPYVFKGYGENRWESLLHIVEVCTRPVT